jgi:hypothetical protein
MSTRTPARWSALACLLGVGASAQAAPVISSTSGEFSTNGTVVISGTSFGTKPTAAPLVFDNFEVGNPGAKVLTAKATVGQWDTGAGYDNGAYSNAQKYAGAQSVKLSTEGRAYYNLSMCKNGTFPTVYLDWRVRLHYYDKVSRNWKPWRVYGNNDTLQANSLLMCTSSLMSVQNGGNGGGTWWDSFGAFPQDKWQHYQVILKASSAPNATDGVVMQYIDGQLVSNHTGVNTRAMAAHWDQIRIGHYWAYDGVDECPSNAGADIYLDDVYVDTTWARVELGNAATYAGSTRREVQIPKAWSGTSIQFAVNTGTLQQGATAYLYVTDAAGAVNASGFPVTIGGSAPAAKKPKAPTDLRVE